MALTIAGWQPLEGHAGTTNTLFVGAYKNQPAVLRLNCCSDIPGINRQREQQVLVRIAGFSWAPDVLESSVDQLILRQYQELSNIPEQADLLAIVAQWQSISDVPEQEYDLIWKGYQEKIDAVSAPEQRAFLQENLDRTKRLFGALPKIPDCLAHHDLHIGNLLQNKQKLVVLDWEYAGLGSPWLDVAALSEEFGCEVAALAKLPLFEHLNTEDFQSALKTAIALRSGLNQLWYALVQPESADIKG